MKNETLCRSNGMWGAGLRGSPLRVNGRFYYVGPFATLLDMSFFCDVTGGSGGRNEGGGLEEGVADGTGLEAYRW